MELTTTFQNLGIALGLGLLVGLQRERAASTLAGFRTFPLVTVFGGLCATLAETLGGWVLAAGWLALALLIVSANLIKARTNETDPGLTTEVALLVMFGVGAYLITGRRSVAVVVGGAVAILLYLKPQLHSFARQISDDDFRAAMQFVLISLVILPVLPNRTYGPLDVLNPRQIWWLVVLIVGINLGGYVVYKLFGDRAGIALAGLLGGLISSTATTVSYARRSREAADTAVPASVVIMLASAVVFVRVLAITAATSPELFRAARYPLLGLLLLMGGLSTVLWIRCQDRPHAMPAHGNPSELKSALVFAGLFALVLLAAAAGKEYLGARGLYLVAALSGLTDMDAITLSTAQMTNAGRVDPGTAWRLVLVAAMANLVFKTGVVALLGDRRLLGRMGILFGITFIGASVLLWLWP